MWCVVLLSAQYGVTARRGKDLRVLVLFIALYLSENLRALLFAICNLFAIYFAIYLQFRVWYMHILVKFKKAFLNSVIENDSFFLYLTYLALFSFIVIYES